MPVLETNIPKTNWTLLEWRKYSNEKPKNNDRCLIVIGKDVVAARFLNGAFLLIIGRGLKMLCFGRRGHRLLTHKEIYANNIVSYWSDFGRGWPVS